MARSTHIGAYRILRMINQGGQGTVYLGFDDRLHRRVAIKIYSLPQDRALRRGILHEAQLVASIQSVKLVQIYDLVVASDHVAFIMEYVPGCDLEEFLNHRQPSLSSILTICSDVAAALAVARQQHIVHGDLKASNILVSQEGRVKITDFGIARDGLSQNPSTQTAASLSCVSPEQYLGDPLDIRSDLFALGCLLYRMLSGQHAFVRSGELNESALLRGAPPVVEERISGAQLVPPELLDLLTALLQKSPEDRPANTHQVRSILRKISRETPQSIGNTLLQEAQDCFREESPDDIPPVIPGDLTRNGRSQMGGVGFLAGLSSRKFALAGLLVLVLAGGFLVQVFFQDQVKVAIDRPTLAIATSAELPAELSSQWIATQIQSTLFAQPGSAFVLGPAPPKTYVSHGFGEDSAETQTVPQLRFVPTLQCVEQLCLLDLVLEKDGQRYFQQKLIFTNMPIAQWETMVRGATLALLGQAG